MSALKQSAQSAARGYFVAGRTDSAPLRMGKVKKQMKGILALPKYFDEQCETMVRETE